MAVADLERAGETYRRLGFVLKPGTAHANGIRNLHAKFGDGTEIELITAPAGVDALTQTYRQHLAAGDGPAFLALQALEPPEVARVVPQNHQTRQYVFFGQLNRSPTDRPEHFQHPNTAESLISVWLASDDFSAELDLLKRLGVTVSTETLSHPFAGTARVARAGGDTVLMLPGRYQRVRGRPIIGSTVQVRDLDAALATLKSGGVVLPPIVTSDGRRRIVLPPEVTCGWWLELVARARYPSADVTVPRYPWP